MPVMEKREAAVRHSPVAKTVRRQTFEEWLVEEANAGRMILAAESNNATLPPKPTGTADFWNVYNETRADRF